MDWQGRSKKTPETRRKELFDLYIRRHDRIDDWDLVDRSAITATYYFIRQDDVDDTFKMAEILVHESHDLVQKAVGGWVREAGKKDLQILFRFLDKYTAIMPRTMLRYAIEHFDKDQREHHLGLKSKSE